MTSSIFISYRREDSAAEAGRIASALRREVGEDEVFIDTSSIAAGARWPAEIQTSLARARLVIVVIGPDWLTAGINQWGQRRIDHAEDWVRQELAYSLSQEKEVIPLLVRGGAVPPKDVLPEDIKTLYDIQAVEIRTNYWDHDLGLLFTRVIPDWSPGRDSPPGGRSEPAAKLTRLKEEMIELSSAARADCATLEVDPEAAVQFVLSEGTRHPILFESTFASIPLVFGPHVLLLSWNGSSAIIERVLNRQVAYPLNDVWTACLSLYRQATLLSYRTKGPERLYTPAEAKRSLSLYRRLIKQVSKFVEKLAEEGKTSPSLHHHLEALMEEAEFALANEDVGTSIARMEAILSATHKLLLQFAPSGPLAEPAPAPPEPKIDVPQTGRPTVLFVDDDQVVLKILRELFDGREVTIVTARTSSEALKALVEHEFDLVVTDLVMSYDFGGKPQIDGREVAFAAKRSSAKTKVVVFTAYSQMMIMAELFRGGVDDVLLKGEFKLEELIDLVAALGNTAAG